MIAADSSSLIAYLQGEEADDCAKIEAAMSAADLMIPPPVLAELLSKPNADQIDYLLEHTPVLEISIGFWARAGRSRRLLLQKGLRARLADVLIAQCCIDADAPLITRDSDYRHFAAHCGLKLA